jgi:hypothetical protein
MGRVELLAALDRVQKLLKAGYDRRKIHSLLLEEEILTMSYPTFCFQLNKLAVTAKEPAPVTSAHSARAGKDEPFSITRNPNLRDLV